MTKRVLPCSVAFALVLVGSIATAADRSEVPWVLRAEAGAPCEVEGRVDSRKSSQQVVVRGEVVGIEGVDGPETPVEAQVVFARVDAARQRAFVDEDGRFVAFALLMREERVSCRDGRYLVEGVSQPVPEMEVIAPGCTTEIFRLESDESWLELKRHCGVVRRSA